MGTGNFSDDFKRDAVAQITERGVTVSRAPIRLRVKRFGRHFAACIKRNRHGAADRWRFDEVVISDKLCSYIKPIKILSPQH